MYVNEEVSRESAILVGHDCKGVFSDLINEKNQYVCINRPFDPYFHRIRVRKFRKKKVGLRCCCPHA